MRYCFCHMWDWKNNVWSIWNSMPNLGEVFNHLSHAPAEVTDDDMDNIERFFVVLHSRTSPLKKVNEARKQLFAQGNRQSENTPPTKEALRQHVKRAVFQAGHIWGQSQIANPELPSPADWGWAKNADDVWHPFWTVIPEASKGCRELIKCKCKNGVLETANVLLLIYHAQYYVSALDNASEMSSRRSKTDGKKLAACYGCQLV